MQQIFGGWIFIMSALGGFYGLFFAVYGRTPMVGANSRSDAGLPF